MSGVPRPERDDPLFAPYWEGTDLGELRVQRCAACGELRWPPRPMCGVCQTAGNEWAAVPGRGTLYSWVGVDHQTVRGLPAPYTVGLVALDGLTVRMLGRIVESDRQDVVIGMELVVRFDPSDSGVTLANWEPARESRP